MRRLVQEEGVVGSGEFTMARVNTHVIARR